MNPASKTLLAFVCTVMGGVAFAGGLIHLPRFHVSVGEFWKPNESELAALARLDRDRLSAMPAEEVREQLAEDFMLANQAAVMSEEEGGNERAAWLAARWDSAVKEFVKDHGARAYMAVGTWLSMHFRKLLEEVSNEIALQGWSVQEWLKANNGKGNKLWALRSLSGRFAETAGEAGLLHCCKPMDPMELEVASRLFLENWARQAGPEVSKLFPSVEEKVLVLRWKVEAAAHLTTARRFHLLNVLERVSPSYPVEYMRGVLLVKENRPDEAVRHFMSCLDDSELGSKARDWILFLRRR